MSDKYTLEYFQRHGRRGGKKVAKMLSKRQRVERARKAAQARWRKKRQ